jgi:GNAT superfamily N-acetyltransferase
MLQPRAITVRAFEGAEFLVYRSLRLEALEESPDSFESTLASEQLRADDEWASRLHAACSSGFDLPLIGYVGARAAGLAWGKVDSSDSTIVNVYQMWVAPQCRGHGLARLLLRTIVAWAASLQARSVQLGVVCGDSPAMRLYISEGFVPIGPVMSLRSGSMLMVQSLRRHIPQPAV